MSTFKYTKYAGGWKVSGTLANGERVRKSLKGVTRKQAEDYMARLADEAAQEIVTGRKAEKVRTFAEAAEAWLEAGKYLRGIEKAIVHFDGWELDQIAAGDVLKFARKHWSTNPAINREGISPVRAVLNYAYELGWRQHPLRIRMLPETPKKKKVARMEWLDCFVKTARGMDWRYLGYAELALMMALTGRRTGEMIKLRWEDVDWEKGRVLLERTKNGDDQWCAIPEPLVGPLRLLRAEQARIAASAPGEVAGLTQASRARLASGLVFGVRTKEQAWWRWKEITEAAGIEHITPHASGRHTFATRLNEEGWTANDIAAAGGWKGPALVQRVYIHSERDSRQAAETLAKGFGKKLAKMLGPIAK